MHCRATPYSFTILVTEVKWPTKVLIFVISIDSHVADGDEDDGFDETILPADYDAAGQIVDDVRHLSSFF